MTENLLQEPNYTLHLLWTIISWFDSCFTPKSLVLMLKIHQRKWIHTYWILYVTDITESTPYIQDDGHVEQSLTNKSNRKRRYIRWQTGEKQVWSDSKGILDDLCCSDTHITGQTCVLPGSNSFRGVSVYQRPLSRFVRLPSQFKTASYQKQNLTKPMFE